MSGNTRKFLKQRFHLKSKNIMFGQSPLSLELALKRDDKQIFNPNLKWARQTSAGYATVKVNESRIKLVCELDGTHDQDEESLRAQKSLII